MKKSIDAGSIIFFISFLFNENHALACSCIDRGETPKEMFERHPLVFTAKAKESKVVSGAPIVVEIEQDGTEIWVDPEDEVDNLLEVVNPFKGAIPAYAVFKSMEYCGYSFVHNERYLIYAYETGDLFIKYTPCTVIFPINSPEYKVHIDWLTDNAFTAPKKLE